MLDRPLERLFALDSAAPWWIGQAIYQDYALRDHEPRQDWILDEEGKFHLLDWSGGKPRPLERDAQVVRIRRIGNDWLAWPPEALLEACRQYGIPLEQGLRVALRDGPVRWDASFGFA